MLWATQIDKIDNNVHSCHMMVCCRGGKEKQGKDIINGQVERAEWQPVSQNIVLWKTVWDTWQDRVRGCDRRGTTKPQMFTAAFQRDIWTSETVEVNSLRQVCAVMTLSHVCMCICVFVLFTLPASGRCCSCYVSFSVGDWRMVIGLELIRLALKGCRPMATPLLGHLPDFRTDHAVP